MTYLLQQLLTASARRNPAKKAIISQGKSLTYQELDDRSNQLARVLLACGIERGDRVGICMNKCLESIVCIFGILKAGAVYVPIDPGAPPRRQDFITSNCGMKALIGSRKKLTALGPALAESSPVRCVILADSSVPGRTVALAKATLIPWEEVLRAGVNPPAAPPVIEQDLAYILYTSGSTGEPKGVMISHRTSLTFVNWAQDCFRVAHTDRVSSHAPLHFDLSIFDIFATVKVGGTVVLVPEKLSVFPLDLARFIEEQRISIWYSVPSVLTRLVLHGDLRRFRFANLHTILFAGEVFPVRYLRELKALLPHARYFNLFGPTETNVCTYYEVGDIPPEQGRPISIGKACANTEVLIMGEQGNPAQPGEVGELWVRGPSVMKGYWGLPEKTARVLVRHQLDPALAEELLYRTGDLVRQEPDGNLEFLGRRDHQIKCRGYRIELGEIETAIYSHPDVAEAAVVAVPDEEIGNVIHAMVVPREGSCLTAVELEAFCSQRIPRYMLPGVIDFRAVLPRTSTGKVDKTSLVRPAVQSQAG